LRCCEDEELLDIAADSIRRYADVWTAMDRWTHIIDALMDRSSEQEKKGRLHLGLITLLSELGSSGRLTADDMEEVEASLKKHRRVSVLAFRKQ
jgi:mediator of RNA polymerase II transcription subunit 12